MGIEEVSFLNANNPKSIKIHPLVLLFLLDSVLHSIAQRIEHVAMCTKSIKLHRLLLLDSGLCTAQS